MTQNESYEYIKAIVDCGSLRWEYRLNGSHVVGRMAHDEDVLAWSDKEIIDLTCSVLDCTKKDRSVISVEYR